MRTEHVVPRDILENGWWMTEEEEEERWRALEEEECAAREAAQEGARRIAFVARVLKLVRANAPVSPFECFMATEVLEELLTNGERMFTGNDLCVLGSASLEADDAERVEQQWDRKFRFLSREEKDKRDAIHYGRSYGEWLVNARVHLLDRRAWVAKPALRSRTGWPLFAPDVHHEVSRALKARKRRTDLRRRWRREKMRFESASQ